MAAAGRARLPPDVPGARLGGGAGETCVDPFGGRLTELDAALAEEIARRQRAEEALRESEEKYRDLVENSEDLICTHDGEGRLLSLNRSMERELSSPAAELLGRNLAELLVAASRAEFPEYLEALRRDGRSQGLLKIQTGSGEERVLQFDSVVQSGTARREVLVVAHDIQRRWAEQALRLLVSRLEALLNNIPDLAWMKDEQGRYTAVNDAFARFVGRESGQIVGKTDFDLVPPDRAEKFQAEDHRAMQTGEKLHVSIEMESAGSFVLFDTIKTPILDARGRATGTVGIARDVTERRLLEEQLVQSQKMEAVGRLAGGIAHDFNNLLTSILGYAGLALNQLEEGSELGGEIEEIRKAGERAAALTQQLLAFSRKQVIAPKVLPLNEVVADSAKMLRRLIGEDIELVTSPAPDLWSVRADPGQLEQVLLNLAVNARDAMPRGGKLLIETFNVASYEPYTASGARGTAPYVLLAVSDTGSGMDAETQKHIFEPFFTTKERGKGTGLGLATVYGIVKQSGGDIWVYSESGQGTTFKVYLPSVSEAPQPTAKEDPVRALRGTETVLLVEDEEAVRRLARRVLESVGYEVLVAANSVEAVELFEREGPRTRILITDVVMPGHSGPDLAAELTRRRPDLKVLYMSGYTDTTIVQRGILNPGTSFLQKPFTPDALARKVREVLDQPDEARDETA